jgi:uncharacterized protein
MMIMAFGIFYGKKTHNMAKDDFLGTGWSFPPAFEKKSGSIAMETGEENIRKSLWVILTTRVGERQMHPKFGCALDELMFEPLNTTITTYIKEMIRTAILYFEPRVDLLRADINEVIPEEGLILINLDFNIRKTNSRFNMVFPFYKNEANVAL